MLVVMSVTATEEQVRAVREHIEADGLTPHESRGEQRVVIGVVGDVGVRKEQVMNHLAALPGVESVSPISKPFKLTSREFHPAPTVIRVGNTTIGGGSLTVMAGPCAVESRDQLLRTADAVAAAGATVLRGGAFKPRTSPYSFQGLGMDGVRFLTEARERTGLPVVTEVMEPNQMEPVALHADIIQIGARNMQNFPLLMAAGRISKPVMLKRGIAATVEEWLMAAEYIVSSGNPEVILCERGIRTFERYTRNTLDLSAVPVIQERTHLPIVVDPSHGTGHRPLVRPLAVAGAAVGADGIIIEVHPDPPSARSDSEQSLSFPEFGDLMDDLRRHEYLRQPTAPHAQTHIEPPVERKRLRARIDDVDARIASLLEERAELSVAVQQTREPGDHGHDVGRERELIERAAHGGEGVLTPEEVEMVFGAIMRVSRSAQRRNAATDAALAGGGKPEAGTVSANGAGA